MQPVVTGAAEGLALKHHLRTGERGRLWESSLQFQALTQHCQLSRIPCILPPMPAPAMTPEERNAYYEALKKIEACRRKRSAILNLRDCLKKLRG